MAGSNYRNITDIKPNPKNPRVIKSCPICKVDFSVKYSHSKTRRVCSMKCRGKLLKLEQSGVNHPLYKSGKSIKQDYTCQSCNNTFVSDKGYEGRNIKFCSKKCAGKSMTVKRPVNKCCQCGDNFISKYLQGLHKFCSISCAAIYNGNKARGVKRPEMSGEKSPFWRGGVTPENELQRKGIDYKKWRTDVFKRDNYTCQHCGQVGGKLNADHIKPFAYFKELRFDINNGRTLCLNCHTKTDTYGAKALKYGIQEFI